MLPCLLTSLCQGGDTKEESLNKILAKSAVVQKRGDEEDISRQQPTHWWDGTPIDGEENAEIPPALKPQWTWPEGCCPYYRTAYRKRSKNFIDHHGLIYKDVYHRMNTILTKPPHFDPVFANIIPSFFYTLHDLYTNSEKYAFDDLSIVFRTFGSDLHDVRRAVHLFATGQHPDFPDFDEPRLQTSDTSSPAFVKGEWIQGERPKTFVYQLVQEDGTVVATGDSEVLRFLHAHDFCGIQDDWQHWEDHGCQPWAGKQVWIPYKAPDAERHYHHVLLDDNMYVHDFYIEFSPTSG